MAKFYACVATLTLIATLAVVAFQALEMHEMAMF